MGLIKAEHRHVGGIDKQISIVLLRNLLTQMSDAHSQTFIVCLQINFYHIESSNLHRILLSFTFQVVCGVNKKFGNIKISVNLFPNHKR